MSRGFVLDTSVLVKWFKRREEALLEEAQYIKELYLEGRVVLALPVLVIYEMGNILCLKTDLSDEGVREVIENLWNAGFDLIDPLPVLSRAAAELSRRHGITFYDACFPALARHLGYLFITADRGLWKKLKETNTLYLGAIGE